MLLENGDLQWTVEPDHPPLRVDHYLKERLPGHPRSALQRYIRQGGVMRIDRASGRLLPLKPASKVRPGDLLRIRRPTRRVPTGVAPGPQPALRILHEDQVLVVVDKPAGMLVHPSGAHTSDTVITQLRTRYGADLDLAHRLDRETSGLLVLTRTKSATRVMKEAFKQRRVHKRYLALVRGAPTWSSVTVDLPLGPGHGEVRVRQAVREDGAPATTRFEVVRRVSSHHTLLAAIPLTGRLHQIRVHLEALGLPLFADKIYGSDGSPFLHFYEHGLTTELLQQLGHWRHALHASDLWFHHPETGNAMHLHAPLPPDLETLVEQLTESKQSTAISDVVRRFSVRWRTEIQKRADVSAG